MHDFHDSPSPWVMGHAPRIRPGGHVLDLACGKGRNSFALAAQSFHVLALDRDPAALSTLHGRQNITTLQADIEQEAWPLEGQRFDAIIICRYLHRPLFPRILSSLSPGGVLIYETFMVGQETLGRPRNPDYLLQPDELLALCSEDLQVVAFEQGRFEAPDPVYLQRICAIRP